MASPTLTLSPDDVEQAPSSGASPTLELSPNDVEQASQPTGPVNPYAKSQPQEGFWHSLGSSLGLTREQAAAEQQDQRDHPVRTALETFGGPAYQAAKGIYGEGKRVVGELTQAGESIEDNNPASTAVHAVQAVPFVGAGIKRGAEQLQPGEAVNPGEAGTALGTAIQAGPMLEGGAESAQGLSEPGVWIPREPKMLPPGEILPPEAPPGPSGGGGGGGTRPTGPSQGGGGGGVATLEKPVQAPPKLSPADQALADRLAAEKSQGSVPPDLKDLQQRAARAQAAAAKARFEANQALQEQRGAQAHGIEAPPFDPALQKNAQLLTAHANELAETAQAATAKFKGGIQTPDVPPAPTQAEVGAQYVERVKGGVPPSVAAAGLGLTPDQQERIHVANALMPNTIGGLAKPPTAPAPPVAPPPQNVPQSPVGIQQQAQQSTIEEVAARAQNIQKTATQIAEGVPPPKPPQIPMPVGMDQGQLSQATVNQAGSIIMQLPAAKRTPAILESVGSIAKWMLDSKTIIAPDGKVVNVDSPKIAQTEAVNLINAEIDRQNEGLKDQQKAQQDQQKEQQKAAKEAEKQAKVAQEERDESLNPEKKTTEKSTGNEQPVEIPNTPAIQKASAALAAAPMDATSEDLDSLIRRTATVTTKVRKAMVEQEIHRRAMRQEDHDEAGMMGQPLVPGQSREELQRWADAVAKREHPYVHIPANSDFKPAGVEGLTRTPVKGAGPFSGTYYHSKDIDAAEIRKAARDKKNPQGMLDAIEAKFKGEAKPIELKPEDVEQEADKSTPGVLSGETKAAEAETKYKFGNTQADIPPNSPAGKALAALRAKIDPADLMPSTNTTDGGGLEQDSHVTVRYGIADDEVAGIKSYLQKQAPFEASLGKTAAFPPSEHSDGAAPIIVLIDSPDLHRMEKELDQHGNFKERSFPEYKPHATVAYVKPEAASKYVGLTDAEGKTFTAKSVSISDRNGGTEEVALKGTPSVTLPPEVSAGLAAIVEEHAAEDPTATLDSVLRDKDTGNFVAQALVNDGILTNSADNVNPKNALLTTSARAKVGDALLGELLPIDVIEQTPDFLKQKLLGTMGAIKMIGQSGDGWDIQPQIVKATERYDQIFRGEETQDQGPVVEAIVKKLDEPIDKVRQAFSSFAVASSNHDASDKPFFDFNLAFGTELTQDQYEKGLKGAVSQPLVPETKPANSETTTAPPETKPLAKGDKVTYRTNKGKERSGEIAWTDGKKVRITDNGSTVNKNIEDVKAVAGPASEAKPEPTGDATLVDALYKVLVNGTPPKDYNDLKGIVFLIDRVQPDQLRMKQAQEAYEAAQNRLARETVLRSTWTNQGRFEVLVRRYEKQPNLSIRTSTSINNQAYSTPLPLAFIADRFAGIDFKTTTVYEPTAGNGALLIAADPRKTQANELDPNRAQTLKDEGFSVTNHDATEWALTGRVDAVVANPPFGNLPGPVKVDGYSIVKLDHLIAAKALGAMKDEGKACIILGAGSREEAGEVTNAARPFFNWLYAHYNVVSDFELEGDLYSRQGASWPVRVIAIDGRVRSAKVSPVADTIPRLKTWGEVYDKAAEHLGSNLEGQRPANNVAGGTVRTESSDQGAVSGTAARPNESADSTGPESGSTGYGSDGGTKLQPGPIQHSGRVPDPGVGSADSTVRPDGDVARSDRLAEGQPAPRTVRRESSKPDGHSANALSPADAIVDESNQFQSSYRPHSAKKDTAVMAPKALIGPMQHAMDKVAEEVGDTDQWVSDQLGYPDVETMHQAFMGTQVDAIAAAIYQMQRGKAAIVADQTGIGKGRVAAAMIRWAELHGHTPVFVTESAPLFSPMYADLQDIGSAQTISPLLFNADASITDPRTGTKIFQNPGAMRPVLDRIRETGELPKGRNAVFLTYSQINTDNRQQLTLQRIAPNALFILDESHNAGGDSNTGNFLSELVTASKGVTFLSATWAKRPDNLSLYAGMTDISIAIPDRARVADAITAGGTPLQAVLTSLLAETGQFVRRERSFDGIEIKNKVDEKNQAEHERIADKVTGILRAIVKADAMYHNLDFEWIQQQAKKAGKSAGSKGVVVQHMEFSSIVHNLVKQLLLALKANTATEEIIAAIQAGEKPVFALENTMGAFLDGYISGHNLKEGDSLKDLDYSRISDRALMRTRYYNETDPMGNKTRIEVPLNDLSSPVRAAYDEAQGMIDSLDVDLPVSPIDYIRNKVEQAGYKIAEITGRSWRIDYSGEGPVLGTVPGIERKDRVNTATQFNNGGLDALIINRAGSTGISLHASEKFRDQRPRHMIIGQPAGDVNIVMQILGRVNRTGQIVLPRYTFLAVALPAEMRPAINLAKKMKSLNANVSSNTRAATSVDAVDLMNKYGDHIVAGYLNDNPEMSKLLGLSANVNEKGEPSGNEGLAMKATGHSALLPVVQQREFMDSITEAYTNYIDFLDETGQNDLEPRTYDYEARELSSQRMYQGVDETSPFGQDATYGEYSIKRQGEPFTPEEVMSKIAETFGPEAMKLAPRERDTMAARDLAAHIEELYKPYFAALTQPQAIERAQQMRTRGRQLLSDYRVGTGLRIELSGDQFNGVVTNIEGAKKPSGNPYAPSSLQFTIAVNSGLRQTKVPGSQMDHLIISNLGRNADVPQLFKDYGTDRQKAKIITGNLLGAFGELKTGAKGRIISFTMDDKSSKLGILMPNKFDIETDVEGTYAMRTAEGAEKFLEGNGHYLQSSGSEIGVFGPTNSRDDLEIRTKMSKAAAGKFFLDPKLLETLQGGEFASSGGLMKATVKQGRELDAVRAIMAKAALYAPTSHVDQARTIDEKAKADSEKPKRPKGASGSVTISFLGAGALDPYVTKLLQPVVDYTKKVVANTWKEATSAVRRSGSSAKAMGHEVAAAFSPVSVADTDALDIMGKALGEPALRLFEAGQFLHDISSMFNAMTEDERIEFVDHWQHGKEQPTQDLEKAQEFMQEVLSQQRQREKVAINLGRKKDREVELSDKSNYFPNRYKVAPGGEKILTEDQQIARLGQVSRRPFEGSKAFMKQQRYTLKQAVGEGAVPLGNPVEMLLRRLQEGAKFIAARYAWYNFKDQGLAMFLKNGKKLPKDYTYIDDKSGNVWRVVQSVDGETFPVQTGRWVIQKDAARLLNNYLSIDHIKGSEVLSAFVKLKNFSTEMKLAISAFHWAYITVENMASGLSTGMDKVVNQGIRGLDPTKVSAGLGDIAKAMFAPYTAIKRGGQIIQYARNPDEFLESPEGKKFAERYPDFPHLMELLFAGGLRWGVANQFQQSFGDHFMDAVKNGELGKATGKFLPWLSHGIMQPLFDYYIPRSKWAFAVELLSTKLAQYSYAIAMGEKTEEEIAREVAESTDNRFGELNWDSLYLNNDVKSAMQFFFRSATWAIGSWRGAYQAVKEQVSSKMFDDKMFQRMDEQARKGDWVSQARRATSRLPQLGINTGWLLSMALLTSTLGSVTEKLATDKYPWEWAQQDSQKNGMSLATNTALEGMHPRTGKVDEHGEPIRVSWPTGLKDYEHGFESPGRYAKGKVSDVAVNAWNTAMNADYFGDYVYNPNDPFYVQLWQGLKYNAEGDFTPMSVDNWTRPYGPQDTASKVERFTGMIGGAPKTMDRSHALTEAIQRHAVANPHIPLTPEQQDERDYAREHPTGHSVRTAAREKNLDYLERVFKQLSYTDAKAIFDDPKTTQDERQELRPLLDRKRINAIKSARRK